MVRISKKGRDRAVSPRRPKALLPKIASEQKKKSKPGVKKHENAIPGELGNITFIPRIK